MIMVYHAKKPTFQLDKTEAILASFDHEAYVHVGDVESNDKEQAFESTNHIQNSWVHNDGTEALVNNPRSTSVGDIFVCEDGIYGVAAYGFTLLRPFN